MTARRTLDDLLAAARARIDRLEPAHALAAAEDGACIVDIRSAPDQLVPGSLLIPRTVLEWRLDPDSASRSPYAPGLGERVDILIDVCFAAARAHGMLRLDRCQECVGLWLGSQQFGECS